MSCLPERFVCVFVFILYVLFCFFHAQDEIVADNKKSATGRVRRRKRNHGVRRCFHWRCQPDILFVVCAFLTGAACAFAHLSEY